MSIPWPRLVWGKPAERIRHLEAQLVHAVHQLNLWRGLAEDQAARLCEGRDAVATAHTAVAEADLTVARATAWEPQHIGTLRKGGAL